MKRPRVTAGPFSFSDYSLGMRVIGLTGGIGCGKSLAAQYFAELGALVIDADQLARAAIERGSDGFDEVVTIW